MTTHCFDLTPVHSSWQPIVSEGLAKISSAYLHGLSTSTDWLPGPKKIFNAFSLPITQTNYILFGESPYPRQQSANGYAFWDASVTNLWSNAGLSKEVNRATSLRNLLKMLMVAEGLLEGTATHQQAIANVDKKMMVQTNDQLFTHMQTLGFLLLNTTPVLQPRSPQQDANAWEPFTQTILSRLLEIRPDIKLLLFGRIAQNMALPTLPETVQKIQSEHPYNLSFIQNPAILHFFKPLHLLYPNKKDKVNE